MQTEKQKLFSRVVVLNAKVLGLVLGLLMGLIIFISTNWLLIKGGENVGAHLQLLSHYFIGYRVSFVGSLIGFFYGLALGTFSGALMGWIYNKIARFRNRSGK